MCASEGADPPEGLRESVGTFIGWLVPHALSGQRVGSEDAQDFSVLGPDTLKSIADS